MDAFDAETGEKLELLQSPVHDGALESSVSTIQLPSVQQQQQQPRKTRPSPTRAAYRDTQSQRVQGGHVDWEQQQVTKVQKAERSFRDSLAGIRQELQRRGLSDQERLSLTTELLEKTKRSYARHVQTLVVEELAREIERELALRLEGEPLGRERMQRRHDKARAFYRAQIERVREESEMALTAAAARNNLLR